MLPSDSSELRQLTGSDNPGSQQAASRVYRRWHAPEGLAAAESSRATTSVPLGDVRTCTSCDFPVSETRTLCLDCEQNSTAAISRVLSGSLEEESWIRKHGYTIASLVVTALTAAVICWLRR